MQVDIYSNRYYLNTSAYTLYISFTQTRDEMEIVLIDLKSEQIFKEIVREGDARMSTIEIVALQQAFKKITESNESNSVSAYGETLRCELGQLQIIKKDWLRMCASILIGEERVNIEKQFKLQYSGRVQNSTNVSSPQIEELKERAERAQANYFALEKECLGKSQQIKHLHLKLEAVNNEVWQLKRELDKSKEIIFQMEKGCQMVNKDDGQEDILPFNKKTQFINYFQFCGNKIIKKFDTVVQLLGSKPIPTLGSKKYCFQIDKANPHMSLGFGVIDSSEIKTQFTDECRKNLIYYWAKDGKLYGDGRGVIKKKGKTNMKAGNLVEMSVSLQAGYVAWFIDGMKEESYYMDKLKDQDIKWVPYIIMTFNGDQITWIKDYS